MKEKKELKRRNNVISNYIVGRTWDENPEFHLIRKIVRHRKEKSFCNGILTKYPYIYDYEWALLAGCPWTGKGDLLLTDGYENFLIIECKFINLHSSGKSARGTRDRKRKKVRDQAMKYAQGFRHFHPKIKTIESMVFTNEGWYLIPEREQVH